MTSEPKRPTVHAHAVTCPTCGIRYDLEHYESGVHELVASEDQPVAVAHDEETDT